MFTSIKVVKHKVLRESPLTLGVCPKSTAQSAHAVCSWGHSPYDTRSYFRGSGDPVEGVSVCTLGSGQILCPIIKGRFGPFFRECSASWHPVNGALNVWWVSDLWLVSL